MTGELAWMESNGLPLLAPETAAAPEDPLRDPTIDPRQAEVCARYGVRPQRPSPTPFVRCIVGESLADGVWPVFGARFLQTRAFRLRLEHLGGAQ